MKALNWVVLGGAAIGLGAIALVGWNNSAKQGGGPGIFTSDFAAEKEAVKAELNDPFSAQFRNVDWAPGGVAVCGEVNAKNAMGGYVGWQRFAVHSVRGDVVEAELSPAIVAIYCDGKTADDVIRETAEKEARCPRITDPEDPLYLTQHMRYGC